MLLRNLDIFRKAFTLRNGFHANGDQTRSGYSSFVYRPLTVEGNFLAAQAIQEMLLQSWIPTRGQRDTKIACVFPATPSRQCRFPVPVSHGGPSCSRPIGLV